MIIRELSLSDLSEFNRMEKELYDFHTERLTISVRPYKPWSYKELEEEINNSGKEFIVAEENGELLGFASGIYDRCFFHISEFWVDEKARGKDAGTALFEEIKRRVKVRGCCEINLTVWNFEGNALKFYEKLGLKVRNYCMAMDI